MQRILEKDPDALPYYNAQKQLSLARVKVLAFWISLASFVAIPPDPLSLHPSLTQQSIPQAGNRGKQARLNASSRRR